MASIKEILSSTQHRQYPLPEKKWKYFQEWHNTVFFHWEIPVYFLEGYIPKGLKLDTFANMAWVSLVSFQVKSMRPRNLPAFPYISNFEEINIRTYVTHNGIRGIYMFSIETNKLAEVILANLFIGLPYQKAEIKRNGDLIFSKNKKNSHHLDIKIGTTLPLGKKTELDFWLTERHSLYDICNKALCRFDIHHKELEIKDLDVTIKEVWYNAGKYTLNTYPDKVQYAQRTEVVLWGKKKV